MLGVGLAVALGLLVGCAADDGSNARRPTQGSAPGQDVKAPASNAADLETWTRAGAGGSTADVTVSAPDALRPCTTVKVGEVSYGALWPQGAIREKDGVRLDGQLYRFGQEIALRGRKYRGGPTTSTCLVTDLWMVLEGS